jgi:hypothetical protein
MWTRGVQIFNVWTHYIHIKNSERVLLELFWGWGEFVFFVFCGGLCVLWRLSNLVDVAVVEV